MKRWLLFVSLWSCGLQKKSCLVRMGDARVEKLQIGQHGLWMRADNNRAGSKSPASSPTQKNTNISRVQAFNLALLLSSEPEIPSIALESVILPYPLSHVIPPIPPLPELPLKPSSPIRVNNQIISSKPSGYCFIRFPYTSDSKNNHP